jgi:apolipoprotein N-acyltransferase
MKLPAYERRAERRRVLRRTPLALAGGVLLAVSLPPFGFWPLGFLGAACVALATEGRKAGGRFWLGWASGAALYSIGLIWATSFNVYGGAVLIAAEAIAVALGALAAPGEGPLRRLLALPAAMTLAEAARLRWPFGGLPLGGVALGQVGGPLLDAARLGGPLLLVWLVWLGGAGLGSATHALRWVLDARRQRRALQGWQVLAAHHGLASTPGAPAARPFPRGALIGGLSALGIVVLLGAVGRVAPDGGAAVARVAVAAVQGGGPRGLRKSEVDPATVLAAQFAATRALLRWPTTTEPTMAAGAHTVSTGRTGGARLVVWPEDVVSLDEPLAASPVNHELAAMARRARATFVVGVTETVSSTRFRNEAVVFAPDGRQIAAYEKVHRVPFGEYVPYRGFFSHLANLSEVPLDAIPGHANGLVRTPAGPLGLMVSYEVFFADRGRDPVRAGAELLVVPTNTSSYATSQVPTQELAASRLQAVEEGRDLVQAAPTGFSAIIDHDGRVLARSALGVRAVLVGTVGLRRGLTDYARTGDVVVLAGAGVLWLAGVGLAARSGRRPRLRPAGTATAQS